MSDTSINVSGNMDPPPRTSGGANRFSFDLQSLPLLSNLPSPTELLQQVRQTLRPWSVFFNLNNFKTATSMQRLQNRIQRNLSYFQSNYIFVFIVLMIYCLISSPMTLLVIAAVAFGCHKVRSNNRVVNIMGNDVSPRQQIILLNLAAIPVLLFVGASSVLFWTLGASCFVIGMHASFYNIDAIVTESHDGYRQQVV